MEILTDDFEVYLDHNKYPKHIWAPKDLDSDLVIIRRTSSKIWMYNTGDGQFRKLTNSAVIEAQEEMYNNPKSAVLYLQSDSLAISAFARCIIKRMKGE